MVLDSAEDSDISEYGGDTGSFATTTAQAYDGAVAIEATDSFCAITRTDQTIAIGETPFGAWGAADVQSPASITYSVSPKFAWGVPSKTGISNLDGYVAGIYYEELRDNPSYTFEVKRFDGGTGTGLASTSVSITELDWYETRVTEWSSNGDMTVELRDSSGSTLKTLTPTDDTYGSGGWGWVDDSGIGNFPCYFDYAYKPVTLQPPSNVQITDAATEDQLTVDGDTGGTGASGYYIYLAESSGSTKSDYTQVADASSLPYTITGLEDGEQFFVRVSSHD